MARRRIEQPATSNLAALDLAPTTVIFLNGESTTVMLPLDARIWDLRERLAELYRVWPDSVTLLEEGVKANDDDLLYREGRSCTVAAIFGAYGKIFDSFSEMGLNADLVTAIHSYGFEKPCEIWQRCLKPMMDRNDVIAQVDIAANLVSIAGTFAAGSLQQVDTKLDTLQVLILLPHREYAYNVRSVVDALGGKRVKSYVVVLNGQTCAISPHVVLGTPGRVQDVVSRGCMHLADLKVCIIHESDEMLQRGFQSEIIDILTGLPSTAQICSFSNNLNSDLLNLLHSFMRNPIEICLLKILKKNHPSLDDICHFYKAVGKEELKVDALCNLLEKLVFTHLVVYCNTRRKVEWLHSQVKMRKNNVMLLAMHPDLNQEECNEVIRSISEPSSAVVLISTELVARVDVRVERPDVSRLFKVVINYDLPSNVQSYLDRGVWSQGHLHRHVISFVTDKDMQCLYGIEQILSTQIDEMPAHVEGLM